MPLTILSQAIAMPWGAKLATVIGPRRVSLLGGLLCAAGSLLGGLAGAPRGLPALALLYAGILGFGIGLGYTSPMVSTRGWGGGREMAGKGDIRQRRSGSQACGWAQPPAAPRRLSVPRKEW